MPTIHVCGSEGEWGLYENTLDPLGLDSQRRGSVKLEVGDQMFRSFPVSNNLWIHARVALTSFNVSNADNRRVLILRDANAEVICALTRAGGGGSVINLNFEYANGGNGAALTTLGETFPQTPLEFYTFDINVRVVSGETVLSLYRDEVLRFTRTLGTALDPLPSQLVFEYGSSNVDVAPTYVQDVIVTDDLPTVGMELATLVPGAAGTYFGFENNYDNIADEGYNQSTVITADATGLRESWIYADPIFDLGDKVIYGVATSTVAQADLSDVVTDFAPFLRINATNYAGTSLGASKVAPNNFVTIWTANPATTNPWTEEDLFGLEAGILSE